MRDGFNGNKTNRNGSILFCICYSQLKIADRVAPIGDYRLFVLFKILHGAFKQLHVVLAGDVFVKSRVPALRVAHLAEDAAVRGADALDGERGIIGVKVHVARRIARKIDILRRDLAVFGKRTDHIVGGEETASDNNPTPSYIYFIFTDARRLSSIGSMRYVSN